MAGPARVTEWSRLRPLLPALAMGLLVFGLFFHADATAAIQVWNTSSAYGHCWLVLPIAAWLAWERRWEAAAAQIKPFPLAALLALPITVAWLAGNIAGVMEVRQFAALLLLETLLLAVLGWRYWAALSVAFIYLIFLVPFGAFLTPQLQDFTAGFVAHGLDFLNIPSEVTAYRIDIPEGTFYVAEACAGLRFLIASIAFGVLYAVTMFQSPGRRATFIAASIVVPIIANGLRALGIVTLGHVLGSAQAATTDHILYGWIFFSIVILTLAVAGMPFRQDARIPTAVPPHATPGTARGALLAAWAVLAAGAIGPAASLALNSHAGQAPDAAAIFRIPDLCQITASHRDGPLLTQRIHCGATDFSVRLEMLPPRANPSVIVAAAREAAAALSPGHDIDSSQLHLDSGSPATWITLRDTEHPTAMSAYALIINGQPALGGLRDRLQLARNLLRGTAIAPAAVTVAVTTPNANPQDALQLFLSGQGDLAGRVAGLGRL